ncbi:hypothetical protein AMTR_s00062p00133530 [Amborella trichopoda]|uniref:Reverse transcriptase zinc-binding domain-containing protein n=1 Tax=Amborella trichopoda TaxID=13333 RepID=U5D1Y3_AMBTC|nr:hypothetical protein AMTR_s00062p00133530 [Amborella trichopoda]
MSEEEVLGGERDLPRSWSEPYIPSPRKRRISHILGCAEGSWPSIYLGLPFFTRTSSTNLWKRVVDRIQKKLASWKGKLLTLAGRAPLRKSAIQSIPTYVMSWFYAPEKVKSVMESLQRAFLWAGGDSNHGVHLVAWDSRSRTAGGGRSACLRRTYKDSTVPIGVSQWGHQS